MKLKHKIWRLKKDLEHHEHDVEELRADLEHQCDRYNELWKAHGDLLMEAQTLRSQVPIRKSGAQVEGVKLGARAVRPEV